ncbi:MAG: RNA polymerase sigma-70 factor [Flavobacteriales bacterium]|jgi:RNA polymerase sigma-70 factor (ECF subfamily)|nr:RNA polymerase sigma-70 factor [Flavobacteriales bacterium]
MATSEQLLVHQMKEGNKEAFEKLFHEHYSMLCRFGFTWVQDADEVEEIVQDIFVSLWEKRATVSISTSIRSYLFSAVRNACLNHVKHLKVRAQHRQHVLVTADSSMETADQQLQTFELQSTIRKAVENLPERCREVFLLSRVEGLKYAQIAEELSISVKTVENQMGKALKTLRLHLKDYLTVLVLTLLNL